MKVVNLDDPVIARAFQHCDRIEASALVRDTWIETPQALLACLVLKQVLMYNGSVIYMHRAASDDGYYIWAWVPVPRGHRSRAPGKIPADSEDDYKELMENLRSFPSPCGPIPMAIKQPPVSVARAWSFAWVALKPMDATVGRYMMQAVRGFANLKRGRSSGAFRIRWKRAEYVALVTCAHMRWLLVTVAPPLPQHGNHP